MGEHTSSSCSRTQAGARTHTHVCTEAPVSLWWLQVLTRVSQGGLSSSQVSMSGHPYHTNTNLTE